MTTTVGSPKPSSRLLARTTARSQPLRLSTPVSVSVSASAWATAIACATCILALLAASTIVSSWPSSCRTGSAARKAGSSVRTCGSSPHSAPKSVPSGSETTAPA
ncbi:MAG: hypothetical protein ACXVFV_04320 [Mycobacteriales bacterium]